jgi:hypothetical protein
MRHLIYGAVAVFATIALPASAQTQNQGGSAPVTAPSAQNSGTGIAGQPGGKSGPAARSSGPAAANDQDNRFAQQQDSSKIPGKPGGKSGETVKPSDPQQR